MIDLGSETAETLEMYGTEPGKPGFATNCLLARRLVERGVRFVQLYHTEWDHHGTPGQTLTSDLDQVCRDIDQPCAALIKDLKTRLDKLPPFTSQATMLRTCEEKTLDWFIREVKEAKDKDALLATLAESHRVLKSGGRLIVLMPNIRYLPGRYWDFLDHHLPLTHVSLVEALGLTGFRPEKVIPRFLPYTVKDARVSIPTAAIALYLRFPPAWRILGKQMLVVATAGELPAG